MALSAAAAAPAFAGKPDSPQATATSLAARMDAVIDRAIADRRIVGAVVMVARDGQVIYRRAAGLADRETGKPMALDAVFRLASVTKPIVSVAAMRLVQDGKLSLDDRVDRWLPEFRPNLADGSPADIRIRHLLTHTAGMTYGFIEGPDNTYAKAGVSDGLDESPVTLDENLHRLAGVPLKFSPGSAWNYSIATDVLGAVIQRATGLPLPAAVRALVTEPVGMRDTGFMADASRLTAAYIDGQPEPLRLKEPTTAHLQGADLRLAPDRALDRAAFPSGGAGMSGTAPDILRFLEILRQGGSPVLSADTARTMMADRIAELPQKPAPGWGFGYGWAVFTDPAQDPTPQSPGTIGWGGVYGHSWFVDPAERLTVVALTNTSLEGMSGAFPFAVRDAAYD